MNELPRPLRSATLRAGRAVRGGGSILAVVATVAVLAYLLAGRSGPASDPSPSSPPVAVAAGASVAVVASAAPFGPDEELESPAIAPASGSPEPADPTPTATPTPTPTAKPTPAPTKRPATATPRPTHDPAPEPTPWLGKASGTFGQTLTIDGVKAYLQTRAPSDDPTIHCVSGEPTMQDYTEVVSYTLRITWPDPSDATEPFIGVGTTPYFSVIWWDPDPFHSGVTYVASTCRRPGDSDNAVVSFASNGGPPRTYRFSFR